MASSDIVTTSSRTSDKGSERPYPYPSHVNAASFVSIKLSGKANYDLWKEQMMCLVKSHDMVDFIDGKVRKPRKNESKYKDWKRSDTLVKGCIFGSLSEVVMDVVVGQDTAKDVWSNLRKTFRTRAAPTTRTIKKGSERPYPYPSHVNAASFVSIKLSGKANYDLWKEQMMCLVESHDMVDFIDGKVRRPRKNESKYKDWKRSDTLVKGWIFGSISEDVMRPVISEQTAKEVWGKLMKTTTITKWSQPFPYPSDVNAASFLSIKLSGKANYEAWEKQMICLLESHDMVGFTDGKIKPIEESDSKYWKWKRSDTLVKGWIFGSLSEEVMHAVVGQDTAKDVWSNLRKTYGTRAAPPTRIIKKEYRSLYEAILSGEWEKARDIFNSDNNALTAKINNAGDSALHVAIGTCKHIKFVNNLLKKINRPESLPDLVNTWREHNPLHHAALAGNTEAAEMLVKENPSLLFKMDKQQYLPVHTAILGSHEKTFRYLFKVTKIYFELSKHDGCLSPFERKNAATFLARVITEGHLDAAFDMTQAYPNMVRNQNGNFIPLKSLAGMLDTFPSGTDYNFYQRFVYSYMLKENDDLDLDEAYENHDIENQYTNNDKIAAKGSRSCFNTVIRMIYVKFWNVALLHAVPQMKHLQVDKVKHKKALMVLKYLCQQLGERKSSEDNYLEAFTIALENDIPEVVEGIIRYIPEAIWMKHNDYNLTQFAIINRCEKVYSLLVHQMVMTDYKNFSKTWHDEDGNNSLHLAGRLAPMDKLNLVPGAALQMQRELQWFEEVKNIVMHGHINKKNRNQETPIMVFRREHNDLRKQGEEWMKKTADSYTITAALIITIVFAAAITVPGGNNGDTGKPIYAAKAGFIIFAVTDAISLFASTTSLLLFLSVLTARYQYGDFLYRLPKRLILGLLMLFLSVTSMMVAFSATLYIMFGQEKAWILIPIAAFTCLPIASFVTLQLPLLVDLISSTYGQGIFGNKSYGTIK